MRLPLRIAVLIVVGAIEEKTQAEFLGALTHDRFHIAGHAAGLLIQGQGKRV
ncbi:hypothetical protein ACYT84_24000 [Ralstonia solanacearum]